MGYPRNLPQTGGKEIKVDHDALKDIAKKLRADMQRLQDAHFMEDIEDLGDPGQAAIGDYSAGKGLHNTTKTASSAISSTYSSFLTAYENVVKALEASEQNHRNADDKSKQGVQNTGGGRFAS